MKNYYYCLHLDLALIGYLFRLFSTLRARNERSSKSQRALPLSLEWYALGCS